jgi:hypothetical protein
MPKQNMYVARYYTTCSRPRLVSMSPPAQEQDISQILSFMVISIDITYDQVATQGKYEIEVQPTSASVCVLDPFS